MSNQQNFDATVAESNIEKMIDELKGLCSQNGLGNQAGEEEVITNVFIYKFLNDKMMHNLSVFADECDVTVDEILADRSENGLLQEFYDEYSFDVRIEPEQMIGALASNMEQADFATQLDDALEGIASNPANRSFTISRDDGSELPLLSKVTTFVSIQSRMRFAKSIMSTITKFSFADVFAQGSFDFFSRVFEYLIKDYNVASGKYAEYFTPQAVCNIIAKCMVGMREDIKAMEIHDPAAGSGSLVIHLAHALGQDTGMNKARIYTQDISAKSTRFCRLNMILNGFSDSLDHIAQGDTMLNPMHYQQVGDPHSGLRKFPAVVANPPFNLDFSSTRDAIASNWAKTDRFFAGVPTIPKNKKDSMAIYLLFIQHILYVMEDDGIAAIVLPSGFLTKTTRIEKGIKQALIDNQWLKGVITMPSNIFANTATSVSILFIDKKVEAKPVENEEDAEKPSVILIDASHLGHTVKDNGNQRTILSAEEEEQIIGTFKDRTATKDFSVVVPYDEIAEAEYSLSPGQYFPVTIATEHIDEADFAHQIEEYKHSLTEFQIQSNTLLKGINDILTRISLTSIEEG